MYGCFSMLQQSRSVNNQTIKDIHTQQDTDSHIDTHTDTRTDRDTEQKKKYSGRKTKAPSPLSLI